MPPPSDLVREITLGIALPTLQALWDWVVQQQILFVEVSLPDPSASASVHSTTLEGDSHAHLAVSVASMGSRVVRHLLYLSRVASVDGGASMHLPLNRFFGEGAHQRRECIGKA